MKEEVFLWVWARATTVLVGSLVTWEMMRLTGTRELLGWKGLLLSSSRERPTAWVQSGQWC